MKDAAYIHTAEQFRQHLLDLHEQRKFAKRSQPKRTPLSKTDRYLIHAKTGGKCHVCGQSLSRDKFEADHVTSHITGGTSVVDNYLPACKTCNIYRWHRLPEEIQWVMKIGVWASGVIQKGNRVGKLINDHFTASELKREMRRKKPRVNE